MFERVDRLRKCVEMSSQELEGLLDAYSHHVDMEQAVFIRGYLHSLKLDFEMAMTRGEESQLQLIVEDVTDLLDSASIRLRQQLG